jgi:hypothetical protein
LIDQEPIDPDHRAPQAQDPVGELFWRWGLRTGRHVLGWTVDSVALVEEGRVAFANFSRGPTNIRVRFRRAGDEPRFARVGAIDVAYDKVDSEELSAEVGNLVKLLAVWLKRHGGGTALVPLLAPASPDPEDDLLEPAKTTSPTTAGQPANPDLAGENNGAPHGNAGFYPNKDAVPGQPYIVVHDPPPLDPAKKTPPDRPVLGFEFIDVEDVVKYPDALREIYNGTRGGLVVRGVYSKEDMARVVSRLESKQQNFPRMLLPKSQKSYFLGLCLEGGDPTLKDYLRAAARFREETLPVFAGMEPFESRIERLFRSVAGGRAVKLARYSDGRAYTPATIRILPEGGQLAPHCGNEMFNRPSYTHLHSIVDEYDQISYFLTLQEAEEGGGLIIYSLKWSDVGSDHILPDGRSNVGALLGEAEWMEVRPSAGDVLMFDGGRYLHRVDWVKGRTRWTMGGFLMFDRSGESVLYWA